MQKDEHKRILLCIANMYIGLTPLNRIQDKCNDNEHIWSTPHNAVITHCDASQFQNEMIQNIYNKTQ